MLGQAHNSMILIAKCYSVKTVSSSALFTKPTNVVHSSQIFISIADDEITAIARVYKATIAH